LVYGVPLSDRQKKTKMLKLSTVETNGRRKLVVEGKLVRPWTDEVERAWRRAQEHLMGRELVVDLTNVTLIGPDGENTLLNLMRDGAQFKCGGVLTKHLLKQLARRCRPEP
jgi:hypothetical protein